jgi:hypothetical protein
MSALVLKIGRRFSAPVASLKEASELYDAKRDASEEGASTFPWGDVFDDWNNLVARVSYNARVWAPGADIGDTPLYDPYKQGAAA